MDREQVGQYNPYLAWFSKILCLSTVFLIFMGGEVKSHNAGLSVPDWPTSFGYNMFTFPPSDWVGNIFYEHVHRLIASGIGLLTVVLAIWLFFAERRTWVKVLGGVALLAVIAQGVLGGLTVLLLLPPSVSIAHGVLAQSFLVITVLIAYSLSREWFARRNRERSAASPAVVRFAFLLLALVFLQLFAGAVMRHTESGLAIPDFPKTGDSWVPWATDQTLAWVNAWRAQATWQGVADLPPVTLAQVWINLIHRMMACLIAIIAIVMTVKTVPLRAQAPRLMRTMVYFDFLVSVQIGLGAWTILSMENPLITSLHVVTGAVILTLAAVLLLRAAPVSLGESEHGVYGVPAAESMS